MKGVKWVILVSILSVFAGATAALVTIAWFMPLADTGIVYFGERPSVLSGTPYNPIIERETKERLLAVYDERFLKNGIAYEESAKLGKAVVLSSDGWVLMYATGEAPLKQFLRGVDSGGGIHEVEKLVADPDNNFLYIKFDAADFPVQSFVDWSQVGAGKIIYVANGNWQSSHIRGYEKPNDAVYIWKLIDRYALEESYKAGSVVYDEGGRFMGFVGEGGLLELASRVQNSFASVVEKQIVESATHSWLGEFVDGYIDQTSEALVDKTGFLVVKVEATESALKAGDIILELNGRDLEIPSFARNLRNTVEPFSLTVLRNKELRQITISPPKI